MAAAGIVAEAGEPFASWRQRRSDAVIAAEIQTNGHA
jgi:hypothetical protein